MKKSVFLGVLADEVCNPAADSLNVVASMLVADVGELLFADGDVAVGKDAVVLQIVPKRHRAVEAQGREQAANFRQTMTDEGLVVGSVELSEDFKCPRGVAPAVHLGCFNFLFSHDFFFFSVLNFFFGIQTFCAVVFCRCKVRHKKNAAEGFFRRVQVLPSFGTSFSLFTKFLPKKGVFLPSFTKFFTK